MTQEEKELLLKDLCARIPYDPFIALGESKVPIRLGYIVDLYPQEDSKFLDVRLHNAKPYLRPMSNMTKEEKKEYDLLCDYYMDDKEEKYYFNNIATIDWYHQKHFDCRGLIKLGLALEAPDGMYKLNETQSCI